MVMRRLLGSVLPTLLLVAALGACGDEDGGTASDDPTPTASGAPTKTSSGDEVDFELVEMLTETAAGGSMSEVAVPLVDDAAVQEFNAQFETDAMPARVQDTVAETDVPDGMLLYGAVVSIGCDSPTDVSVSDGGSGLVITASKVPSPMQECFAPMTTVALVLAPISAVS
jgi:hypothetical protein